MSEPGKPRRGCAGAAPGHGPASGCSGARAYPGALMSLGSGPDPGEERTAQGLPQQGSRVPALPLGRGRARPPAPCLQRQRSLHTPSTREGSAPGAHVGQHSDLREPALSPPPLASQEGQRAQGAEHLAGSAEGHEPTAPPPPRCQRCPHTKAGASTQARRSAARVPRRRSSPAPCRTPQPLPAYRSARGLETM